jgi:hypothetical protein
LDCYLLFGTHEKPLMCVAPRTRTQSSSTFLRLLRRVARLRVTPIPKNLPGSPQPRIRRQPIPHQQIRADNDHFTRCAISALTGWCCTRRIITLRGEPRIRVLPVSGRPVSWIGVRVRPQLTDQVGVAIVDRGSALGAMTAPKSWHLRVKAGRAGRSSGTEGDVPSLVFSECAVASAAAPDRSLCDTSVSLRTRAGRDTPVTQGT